MQNRIRDLREDRDMRQSDLAEVTGIDQRTISNYETGKTSPDAEALIILADFFDVTIDYLVGRANNNLISNTKKIAIIEQTRKLLDELKKSYKR